MDIGQPNAGDAYPPGADGEVPLHVLERIVAGEGSPADEAVLAAWVGNDPARRRAIDRLRAQWGAVPEAHDVDAGWRRVMRRLETAANPDRAGAALDRTTPRRMRSLTIGSSAPRSRIRTMAVGTAAAAVAALAFWLGTTPRSLSEPASPRVYATATGQRTDVRLPDGTQVVVAPGSRVRLAADFGAHRRDVYVDGEAYFKVTHDAGRPFTVFAANASVRDIGTAFAVRSYAEEGAVRVVVTEGEVVMSGAGPLVAGDVGRLTADGNASIRRGVDVAALVRWTRGELVFEDATLGQVLGDLRRWYGVEARVADSALATLPFTGSLNNVSPLQGLELAAATLGLRVARDSGRIVLYRPKR